MKSLTKELWMKIPRRRAIKSIHREVERLVAESGVREGLVLVNAMHITASVFINDNEPGLHHDYDVWLESLAPFDASPGHYQHNRTGEDNADAHLKRQVMGARWWWPLPRESFISGRGSTSFITSSTVAGANGCWSK